MENSFRRRTKVLIELLLPRLKQFHEFPKNQFWKYLHPQPGHIHILRPLYFFYFTCVDAIIHINYYWISQCTSFLYSRLLHSLYSNPDITSQLEDLFYSGWSDHRCECTQIHHNYVVVWLTAHFCAVPQEAKDLSMQAQESEKAN